METDVSFRWEDPDPMYQPSHAAIEVVDEGGEGVVLQLGVSRGRHIVAAWPMSRASLRDFSAALATYVAPRELLKDGRDG